jgi:hypothetical protein
VQYALGRASEVMDFAPSPRASLPKMRERNMSLGNGLSAGEPANPTRMFQLELARLPGAI